jgi:FlaA1/EpsC-like NDP-sugar epimerase
MLQKLRNRHFFAIDILLIVIIPFISLGLRVDLPSSRDYIPALAVYIGIALVIKLSVFYFFDLYRRYWRFASIDALLSIVAAVLISTPLMTAASYFVFGLGFLETGLPRSIPFIDALLTLVMVGGIRFLARASVYYQNRYQRTGQAKRVLIAGAGDAGQIVAREIYTSEHISFNLVGFVDDEPTKIGATIHGARVFGPLEKIPSLVEDYRVDEVIIAMPTASGSVIRAVVDACEQVGVSKKILPGVYELLSGQVNINRLRNVEIGDLLRRDPVQIDISQVKALLSGKRILVTGAGGSIGSELCKQIATCHPDQLVLIGHGENSLYRLKKELSTSGFEPRSVEIIVADIRHKKHLRGIFSQYQPEIVFHAAAHKHVPLMEQNVEEAVTNNVLGTWNLVQLARDHHVSRFVLISTDKAVHPINVMGMTKCVAEKIVHQMAARTERPYVSVRFGNVLGSRGSVVPLFQNQIARGGPVTVTDPAMERFFMTIPEAVQLVLQASALGTNGELFVLDMGEPVKIDDLARDMIELSGFTVGEDIEIEYVGLRPGERLSESLFNETENPCSTEHEKIFVSHNGVQSMSDSFEQQVEELIQAALACDSETTRRLLSQLSCDPPS